MSDDVGRVIETLREVFECEAPAVYEPLPPDPRLAHEALRLAGLEWPVFPLYPPNESGGCTCPDAKCEKPGKHPLAKLAPHGLLDASTDAATVSQWWTERPDANIGVAVPEGYVVVDVDGPEGEAALKEGGVQLTPTAISKTGRGNHFFYKSSTRIQPQTGVLTKVDIRGPGSYIIAPPSRHASGVDYEWCARLGDVDLEELPESILAICNPKNRVNGNGHEPSGENWITAALAGVEKGRRNAECARLAGYFIRKVAPDIARSILQGFGRACRPPLTEDEVDSVIASVARTAERETPGTVIRPAGFESLSETIKRHLLLADPHLIDVVAGALVANLFRRDPLWLLLVQPPSSAKTEILEGAAGIPAIYPLSDLTACTFLSGTSKKNADTAGAEPSLLMRLDGRILMMKDFGTVLSMHRDKRQEILAQLREIYDGHYRKDWGTGKSLDWRGHVGFIGAVTTAIDTHYSALTMLGERFTLYRATAPERNPVAHKALENLQSQSGKTMRADISAAFRNWHGSLTVPALEDVSCPKEIGAELCHLADLTALVRTSVARDGYTRLILTRPEAEGPSRLVRQFYLLAAGIAVAHGRTAIEDHELSVMRRVAASTMPAQRLDALEAAYKRKPDDWTKTRDFASDMHYPKDTAEAILQDLVALGLMEPQPVDKGEDGRCPYAWRLSDATRSLLKATALIEWEAW